MNINLTAILILLSFCCFSQHIGYEWLRSIKNSSKIISVIDNENNLLISGNFSGIISLGHLSVESETNKESIYLAKLDLAGNPIWLIRDTLSNIEGITVEKDNFIYLTGSKFSRVPPDKYGYTLAKSFFISKYNSHGQKFWTFLTKPQIDYGSGNYVTSIAIDNYGSLYITGNYSDSISFGPFQLVDDNASAIYISKFDSLGSPLWVKNIHGINSNDGLTYGKGNDIIVDKNNFIYVTGYFRKNFYFGDTVYSNNGLSDIFLTKLSKEGDFIKTLIIGGKESDEGDRLIVDNSNNIALLLKFGDEILINNIKYQAINNYNNIIVIKFNNDSIISSTFIGHSSGGDINAEICFDKNQNTYVVCQTVIAKALFPTIYKINNSGGIDWKYLIGQSSEKFYFQPSSLVTDTSNGIYIAGKYKNFVLFGDSLLGNSNNVWQSFLGKVDTTNTKDIVYFDGIRNSSGILIFPTITNSIVNITSIKQKLENSNLKLYNLKGQLVKTLILKSFESTVDLEELIPGIYFIEICGETFRETFKIIKH